MVTKQAFANSMIELVLISQGYTAQQTAIEIEEMISAHSKLKDLYNSFSQYYDEFINDKE